MKRVPKFRFKFDDGTNLYADTMQEMCELYFQDKERLDQHSYQDFTFSIEKDDYVRTEYEDYRIFAELYEKKELILKKMEGVDKDFV